MASNTPNLGLLKKDPVADANDTFNVQTMLNENWDKVDAFAVSINATLVEMDKARENTFYVCDTKQTRRASLGEKWRLCNGATISNEEAPDYYTVLKQNPGWTYDDWFASEEKYDKSGLTNDDEKIVGTVYDEETQTIRLVTQVIAGTAMTVRCYKKTAPTTPWVLIGTEVKSFSNTIYEPHDNKAIILSQNGKTVVMTTYSTSSGGYDLMYAFFSFVDGKSGASFGTTYYASYYAFYSSAVGKYNGEDVFVFYSNYKNSRWRTLFVRITVSNDNVITVTTGTGGDTSSQILYMLPSVYFPEAGKYISGRYSTSYSSGNIYAWNFNSPTLGTDGINSIYTIIYNGFSNGKYSSWTCSPVYLNGAVYFYDNGAGYKVTYANGSFTTTNMYATDNNDSKERPILYAAREHSGQILAMTNKGLLLLPDLLGTTWSNWENYKYRLNKDTKNAAMRYKNIDITSSAYLYAYPGRSIPNIVADSPFSEFLFNANWANSNSYFPTVFESTFVVPKIESEINTFIKVKE